MQRASSEINSCATMRCQTQRLQSLMWLMPSEHAGSDLQPIWVSTEALAKRGPDDYCTLACFQTGSVWLKPDTARTRSDPGCFCTVWLGPSVEECNQIWKWETGTRPVAFWQDRAWQFLRTGLRLDQVQNLATLESMIQAFFGRMEPNQMQEVRSGIYDLAGLWLHASCNGHIWLYPVGSSIFRGYFTRRPSHSSGHGAAPSCFFLAVWWWGVQW